MSIQIIRKIASLVAGGGSGTAARAVGVLSFDVTVVGNVGAGEDTLMTYTLPANTLGSGNGRGLRIIQFGTTASNINAKTLKLYFGASELTGGMNLNSNSVTHWRAETYLVRTGASTQKATTRLSAFSQAPSAVWDDKLYRNALTIDETATIIIKATGTAVADNDITQELALVEILN